MSGFGGVLSFALQGGFETIKAFLPLLHFANLAANLGAVETVAGPPATTSHVESTSEERRAAGLPETLIRYSVGIDNPEDLIADLRQALIECPPEGSSRPSPCRALSKASQTPQEKHLAASCLTFSDRNQEYQSWK
jgi:hypothetical protein